jgi:hypothetical protein
MAKKVVLIILGILVGLCGIGALCTGGIFLGIGGTNGSIESGYHGLSTQAAGYVSDPNEIQSSSNVTVSGSDVTLKIDAKSSGKPVFLGIGPTRQVDAYLAGVAYERIDSVNFSPFKLTTTTVDGTGTAGAPGDQGFWVAKASGSAPELSWKFASGDYQAVIMNQDGSAGVQTDVRIGVKAPIIGKFGLGGVILGALVALAGLALLIWGIRTKRRQPPMVAYPGGPTYPTSPYGTGSPYDAGSPYGAAPSSTGTPYGTGSPGSGSPNAPGSPGTPYPPPPEPPTSEPPTWPPPGNPQP